jgi:hypothetical protein
MNDLFNGTWIGLTPDILYEPANNGFVHFD